MKKNQQILLTLICTILCAAALAPLKGEIFSLRKEKTPNPESILRQKEQKKRNVVMVFYDPTCPRCAKFEENLSFLQNKLPDLDFIMVNTGVYTAYSNKKNITAVPTFFVYKKGLYQDTFQGYTSPDSFMQELSKVLR